MIETKGPGLATSASLDLRRSVTSAGQLISSGIATICAVLLAFVPWSSALASAPATLVELVRATVHSVAPPLFQYALIDLNDDGIPDAIVLLHDSISCGSAGCNLIIARGTKRGFQLVSSGTISRTPILVSNERRYGWRTLLVTVDGGGTRYGQVVMRFNGWRYPFNPSMQPYAEPGEQSAATELQLHE